MPVILKYTLDHTVSGYQTVMMPAGARVISVQAQKGKVTLWAWVPVITHEPRPHLFMVVGTGQHFDTSLITFIGTVQLGDEVWHVFEEHK